MILGQLFIYYAISGMGEKYLLKICTGLLTIEHVFDIIGV
jgi:hypothetical protein